MHLKLWPVPFLFAAQKPETDAELQRRLTEEPLETAVAIARQRLANVAMDRLDTSGTNDEAVTALQRAATIELGWIAKRRLALSQLDDYCHENGVSACTIKGACTSLLYYPAETLRWSNDIDIVLTRDQLQRLFPDEMHNLEAMDYAFPRLHVSRKEFSGTAVEMHFRFSLCERWGSADTIHDGMKPLRQYQNLHAPTPCVAATIILLHILKDRGRGTYDLLDWHYLDAAGVLDWQELISYWTEHRATPFILPPLRLAQHVTGRVPDEVIEELEATLSTADRRLVSRLIEYIDAPKVTRLRNLRVRCDMMERSFLRFCFEGLMGTTERTGRITGLRPKQPTFWINHCAVLPARRVVSFARKFLRTEEPD